MESDHFNYELLHVKHPVYKEVDLKNRFKTYHSGGLYT